VQDQAVQVAVVPAHTVEVQVIHLPSLLAKEIMVVVEEALTEDKVAAVVVHQQLELMAVVQK
jgi:hypothetical protein